MSGPCQREGPNPGRSPRQQPVSELMSGPVGIKLRPPGSPERPDYIASSGQARAKEIPSANKLPVPSLRQNSVGP